MSDLNLENIVGFKAVDKDGNEQNVTVDEMVDMVSTRMVMALSETSTFAAAAATGNDVYENELPTVTDAANVRVLQSSGDAAKMTMQSLASKLGGLLPLASITSKGLISGLIVFNAYISSTTTCVLIEGSFNESGGMGVVNLDFRPYGMASYSISLFIDSVVRASVINGTNKNSFSIYYLTEGGLIRIKIIFIYDGPISMVARGNNTVIKSISKSENLDTNGFNKVTIS
ncbi:hypothetical protein [Phocaeicola vulgatus]|uniref:Uncharacterized protein n=2 Tax=Phocaeicola vulgatus TaxID=821 RepID=A0AAW5BJM1_PHOVU|nr:hypothetical protein [Phocaeicola vulgatus]MCG4691262.1 hypothetical protein [Phocaeicola vulgatus]